MAVPEHVDFICLGAGIGGMAAAIRAHDLGLSTIVLEKSDQLGGVAAYSSGQLWCPANHLAAAAGIDDTWEEGFEYLRWVANGAADDVMLETFCRTAAEAFAYYDREAGVRWCLYDLPDNHYPDAPGSKPTGRFIELEPFEGGRLPAEWRDIVRHSPTSLYSNHEVYHVMGGNPHRAEWDQELARQRQERDIRYQGSALAAYFVTAVHARGIPMLPDVDVTRLVVEDGAVVGADAVIGGEERRIRASRGVIVAVGGYDWNAELVKRFDNHDQFGSRAPRSVTGDHFALLEDVRPALHSVRRGQGFGYLEPPELDGAGKARWQSMYVGWPHVIVVNEAGERFGTESLIGGGPTKNGASERVFDPETGAPRNWPCFAIFDSQHRTKYPVGRVLPTDGRELPDCFVSAPTLSELATKLGIDPAGLEATVARFNVHAREGRDPEFRRGENLWAQTHVGDVWMKPNPNLGAVDEPPYYGVQLQLVTAALTQTGLVTDERARVVDEDGEVIQNLYATGNTMAWRDLGGNYHSGTANARGMTWAYIAASHAAGAESGRRPLAKVGS